jgi:hypothetical protein
MWVFVWESSQQEWSGKHTTRKTRKDWRASKVKEHTEWSMCRVYLGGGGRWSIYRGMGILYMGYMSAKSASKQRSRIIIPVTSPQYGPLPNDLVFLTLHCATDFQVVLHTIMLEQSRDLCSSMLCSRYPCARVLELAWHPRVCSRILNYTQAWWRIGNSGGEMRMVGVEVSGFRRRLGWEMEEKWWKWGKWGWVNVNKITWDCTRYHSVMLEHALLVCNTTSRCLVKRSQLLRSSGFNWTCRRCYSWVVWVDG